MEKFKGTKGEWMISGGNQIVSMPSQCKISNNISGWNSDEAKANAQLIAAAPEILKSLQRLTMSIKVHPDYIFGDLGKDGGEWSDYISEAEEVIKKALGE